MLSIVEVSNAGTWVLFISDRVVVRTSVPEIASNVSLYPDESFK